MQGWGWRAVHHPDHLARVESAFKEAVAAGRAWEDTFPLRGKDGSYRWFLSRAFPIRDEQDRITRWFGTNTDVTVLRDTQDALRAAQKQVREYSEGLERTVAQRTAELRETVQELEAFSYSIAHDMRAPLRSMLGYAEIITEEHATQLDPLARDYLQRISRSAGRMDQLIRDVLDYSRVVREEMPRRPVDVGTLVRDLVDGYPALRASRQCIEIAPDMPWVIGNAAALTQVFANLLGNAIKFVAPGTPPAVRVWAETVDAEGRRQDAGGWVQVYVKDNGIGLEPAVQPRLFQMFQRFQRPGLYEGTGIGLAIARRATERIGGRIGVDSQPGKGSCFWVRLPAAIQGAENQPCDPYQS
jgi:signal transduction histidine kinase